MSVVSHAKAYFYQCWLKLYKPSLLLQIVWDPVKKRWIDKDASEQDEAPTAPPPKDHELPGGPAGMFPPQRLSLGGPCCLKSLLALVIVFGKLKAHAT